jgi:adenylate kinase family enzyme
VERVVVLGPGASGKSTFARSLAERTGIPWIELDALFWSADLEPTPPAAWIRVQEELCARPRWILDGDLGPYDVLDVRLRHVDAVVVLDLPTWRCAWRAVRRSRERLDFWRWLLTWRRRHRPRLLQSIARHAPRAELFVVRHPREIDELVAHGLGAAT